MRDTILAARHEIPIAEACDALGVSRATLYRAARPSSERAPRGLRRSPRKLAETEVDAIVGVLHSPEFVDQPPGEIVATLLSRGIYHASVRTFYRLLAARDEVRERRNQRTHPKPVKPVLSATAPNQVWTWDITKLAGPTQGSFFCLYVLLDLFSRYVVGWVVDKRESALRAIQLIKETVVTHGVDASQLVLHSDRGAPMKSGSMAQLCATLGIEQSFSRPRVSDDNPYSESQFKTLKYQPDFPSRFGSELHAQGWVSEFFDWYNHHHHHAGLEMFIPGDVYHGRVLAVAERRQSALDAAYAAHPERFVNGPPHVRLPPKVVSINPPLEPPKEGLVGTNPS